MISVTFLATGLIFAASSVFQGLGNTKPPFVSSVVRLFIFAIPVLLLFHVPGLRLRHVWLLSAGSIWVQALMNLWFLRREFRNKLAARDGIIDDRVTLQTVS